MSTIRVARRNRYTSVNRATVNDDRLSFRARGVLFWLLDKPDDWSTDAAQISRATTEGRDAVRTALKELETFGYLRREKKQGADGRWTTLTTVYETPEAIEPTPTPGNPSSVDQSSVDQESESRASDSQGVKTEDCDKGLSDPPTPPAAGGGLEVVKPAAVIRAKRERDLVWEALLAVCGIALDGSYTDNERKAWNKACAQLKAAGATPSEISRRGRAFRSRWPNVSISPSALARRWSECVAGSATGTIATKVPPAWARIDGGDVADGTS